MQLLRSITKRILIEGHRGAEGLAVENSWAAIEAGHAADADLLELDVQCTLDGHLVIYHGYQLPDGRWLRQLHYDEIRDTKPKGHDIVKLEDVLMWVKDKTVGLALDIKNGFGFEPHIFQLVQDRIEAHNLDEQVVLMGWDHQSLLKVKQCNPIITTLVLLRGRPINLVNMVQSAQADAVNLDADMVCLADVETLHEAEIAVVLAETVSPDFSRPVKLGVDVVCCKDPKTARIEIQQYLLSSTG